MIPLTDALAKVLNCQVAALHDYLNHPMAMNKVNDYLKTKTLKTTYPNRNGICEIINFGRLGLKSAADQMAYERYLQVTVQQHFYCRHKIRLMYPRLKCIVEYGPGGHNKFYPIELLAIPEAEDDMKMEEEDEEEEEASKSVFSQYAPWQKAFFY